MERFDDFIIDWLSHNVGFTGGWATLVSIHRTDWMGEKRVHFTVEVDDEAWVDKSDTIEPNMMRKPVIPGEQLYGEDGERRLFMYTVSVTRDELNRMCLSGVI